MITKQAIIEWQEHAPWLDMRQVEQDLIISRALTAIYSDDFLASRLAFRGGTALHRIYLTPQARYSEDIDLVQTVEEPIGMVLNKLREVLGFLGQPTIKQKKSNNTLIFKIASTYPPETPLKLKIEINCKEHFLVHSFVKVPYEMTNAWFSGRCDFLTYCLNEMLGTKIRALYQRRKGRDLFDLSVAAQSSDVDPEDAVFCFKGYMTFNGIKLPTATEYLVNLESKLDNRLFVSDTDGILRPGIIFVPARAYEVVKTTFIERF
jgi:predicted nucleotidyltransferase component of viral defense system